MTTTIICLANSKKYGERCLAGIELKKNNAGWSMEKKGNKPKWIRPVSNTEHGEVATDLVGHIKLMDVVEFNVIEADSNDYQSENVFFDRNSVKVLSQINLSVKNLGWFVINEPNLFGNRGKAVHPDSISELEYSLMFIKVGEPQVYIRTEYQKNQVRMRFTYAGTEYDLAVTDLNFEEKYRADNSILENANHVYLTISLGVLYEGWYNKLIAGVIHL